MLSGGCVNDAIRDKIVFYIHLINFVYVNVCMLHTATSYIYMTYYYTVRYFKSIDRFLLIMTTNDTLSVYLLGCLY